MRRLLQGDVGSGKTILAFEAAIIAIENGYQVALMAPTKPRRRQHYFSAHGYSGGSGYFSNSAAGASMEQDRERMGAEHVAGERATHYWDARADSGSG